MCYCNLLQSFNYLPPAVLFLALLLSCSQASADFSPQFGLGGSSRGQVTQTDGFSEPQAVPTPRRVNVSSSAFAKYRRYFNQLCEGLYQDGRSATLFSILDLNAVPDESCVACRPLLKTIANACKPKAFAKKKIETVARKDGAKGEEQVVAILPTPTPLPRQRDPNLLAVDAMVTGFGAITEEFKYPEELIKAVRRLEYLLTAPDGKSIAEVEYFTILASYMKLPVDRMIKEKGLEETGKPKKNQEELNALFEF